MNKKRAFFFVQDYYMYFIRINQFINYFNQFLEMRSWDLMYKDLSAIESVRFEMLAM